jgi:hypothetical protein
VICMVRTVLLVSGGRERLPDNDFECLSVLHGHQQVRSGQSLKRGGVPRQALYDS